jgi:non-heme Fe2+,alpha-ketoglutarate-dependent halogenase
MAKRLTPQQMDDYAQKGLCTPVRVMAEAQAGELRNAYESAEQRIGGPIAGNLRHKSHLVFPFLADIVRNEAVLDAVEDVIGPDILVWSSNLFVKQAHDPSFVSWHQDSTYWGLSEATAVTAWVALSPSTLESGCLLFAPGSHTSDELPHIDSPSEYNMLTRGQEVQVTVDESKAAAAELKAGEMSLHHVRTVHGSKANNADYRRIGFAVRYIPTRVQQRAGTDFATLVRGEDRFHHFEQEPWPTGELVPAEVKRHGEIMKQVTDTLLAGATSKKLL